MRCPTFLSPMPGGDPSPRPPARPDRSGRGAPIPAAVPARPNQPKSPHIRGTGRALAC
jgi:hypothetical protein